MFHTFYSETQGMMSNEGKKIQFSFSFTPKSIPVYINKCIFSNTKLFTACKVGKQNIFYLHAPPGKRFARPQNIL